MLSWITNTDEKNITVEDSTVIHVEHAKDYGDRARPSVIGAVHTAQFEVPLPARAARLGHSRETPSVPTPAFDLRAQRIATSKHTAFRNPCS